MTGLLRRVVAAPVRLRRRRRQAAVAALVASRVPAGSRVLLVAGHASAVTRLDGCFVDVVGSDPRDDRVTIVPGPSAASLPPLRWDVAIVAGDVAPALMTAAAASAARVLVVSGLGGIAGTRRLSAGTVT